MGSIRVHILDDVIEVQPGDSILRTLQQYGVARGLPGWGFARFCWNAKCQQCILDFSYNGVRHHDYACQTEAHDGTHVHSLPEVLRWKKRLPIRG